MATPGYNALFLQQHGIADPGAPATSVGAPGVVPAGAVLPGAPSIGYSPAYGGVPQVPSPGATAGASIGANTGNLPALGTLATGSTDIANKLAQSGYIANLPNYMDLTKTASGNIGNDLAGVVNPDVINLLQQQGAERGVATGQGQGPNVNAAYLKALGITSMQRQDLGQQELSQAVARTPVGPPFNLAGQQTTATGYQDAQTYANTLAGAPNPAAAAQAALQALLAGKLAGQGSTQPSAPGAAPKAPVSLPNYMAQPTAPGTGSLTPYNAGVETASNTGTGALLGTTETPGTGSGEGSSYAGDQVLQESGNPTTDFFNQLGIGWLFEGPALAGGLM